MAGCMEGIRYLLVSNSYHSPKPGGRNNIPSTLSMLDLIAIIEGKRGKAWALIPLTLGSIPCQ